MGSRKNKEIFKQDLSQKERPGAVFIIALLMKEPAAIPERERLVQVIEKHLGEIECFWYEGEKGAGISVKKYSCQYKDAVVPPQVMITSCTGFDGNSIDPFQRSQMWDCLNDRERILSECKFQVVATDMVAAALSAGERAELDMDFLDALVELYPDCEAVYFHHSGKLILADDIRNYQGGGSRFVRFAVNARFFNIQGTNDMVVDTIGMGTLFLPDLQYHFHGMDPNWVVNHAYCTAAYILNNDNPIKQDDPIDGVAEGELSQEIQWKCSYENSLIQPAREVIDIFMNEYAAGNRGQRSTK